MEESQPSVKNNKGKGKFLKNFCLINKNLIFC